MLTEVSLIAMDRAVRQAREQAIEQCARVAELCITGWSVNARIKIEELPAAIRALKDKP